MSVMRIALTAGLALASGLALTAAPTAAQTVSIEEKHVLTGKAVLEKDSAYIYISAHHRQNGIFLKEPDAADVEAYTKDWEKALAKAQEKYAKALKTWEADAKIAAQTKAKPREKPVQPTRENFSIGSIEVRDAASFGPEYVYTKDKEKPYYSYLMKVKPGIYRYHGPIFFDPNQGYTGYCVCMGSVQFEAKAGQVTDLGNFIVAAPRVEEQKTADMGKIQVVGVWGAIKTTSDLKGVAITYGLPDSLKAWPSVQADFRATGKMDNHYGIMVSRLPPIPGVLGYQRDKVVDLKAPLPVLAAPAVPAS